MSGQQSVEDPDEAAWKIKHGLCKFVAVLPNNLVVLEDIE